MSDTPSKAALKYAEKVIEEPGRVARESTRALLAEAFDAGTIHGATGQYLIADPDSEWAMKPEDAARADQFHGARLWVSDALEVPYERVKCAYRPTAREMPDIGPFRTRKPEDAGEIVFYYAPIPRD